MTVFLFQFGYPCLQRLYLRLSLCTPCSWGCFRYCLFLQCGFSCLYLFFLYLLISCFLCLLLCLDFVSSSSFGSIFISGSSLLGFKLVLCGLIDLILIVKVLGGNSILCNSVVLAFINSFGPRNVLLMILLSTVFGTMFRSRCGLNNYILATSSTYECRNISMVNFTERCPLQLGNLVGAYILAT